jgi:hypothetical protein
MCYYILPSSGIPIARSTVQAVTEADKMQEEVRQELARLEINIKDKIGSNEPGTNHEQIPNYFELYTPEEDDEINTPSFEPQEDVVPDSGDFDPEILDQYIAAQVPQGDKYVLGTVVARKRDAHGNPIGKASDNPIFDTRVYQVSFPNGNTEEYSANIIAENLFSQMDQEGNQYLLIQEIIDHKYEPNESDTPASLIGWYLCVLWKDESTSWEPMKNLKHSFPIQTAEYILSRNLQDQPAFTWWVKQMLKKKERIIKAVNTQYIKCMHKFGIRLPKTVEEAYQIDRETNTKKAIRKEMENNTVAFEFLPEGERIPVGSKCIPCHMIFDVKLDLTRRA